MKIYKKENIGESKEKLEVVQLNIEPESLRYNFVSRSTHAVDTPTAIAIAPPQRVLMALPNRYIDVYDLKEEELLFSFKTVNKVTKLIYCLNGDYVATQESKYNQDTTKMTYLRIYVNWCQQSGEKKIFYPISTRVAGRNVHPRASGFEIIEILGPNPDNIECCQISGNILIQSGTRLIIYKFQISNHEVTALRFFDFKEISFHLEISFVPFNISICENYISCLSNDRLHVFKIEKKQKKRYTYFKLLEEYKDYKKLLKINTGDVVVHLPGVVARNNPIFYHCVGSNYDRSLTCQIVAHDDTSEYTYNVVNFMQVKLKDSEEFKCLVLKPFYVRKKFNFESCDDAFPKSKFWERLAGVTCFVSTPQQGFSYWLSNLEDTCDCVSIYSFAEPVHDVVLKSNLLHTLTKTGLQTYYVNNGEKLFKILEEFSPDPQLDNSTMLLARYKTGNFAKLLECGEGLVLFDDSNQFSKDSVKLNQNMIYLEFQAPEAILANVNNTILCPKGHLRLTKIIHTMLRLPIVLITWNLDDDNLVGITSSDCTLVYYQKVCALLGDYFIFEANYDLCVLYYKMGSILPHEVMKRFKSLQVQNGDFLKEGILYYLTIVLSEDEMEDNQDFLQQVESIFEKYRDIEIAPLVLKSKMLQKSSGKLIDLLLGQSFSDMTKETERLLALVLLYYQNGNQIEAEKELRLGFHDEILYQTLRINWRILFDSSQYFSKLCQILLIFKFEVMVKVLNFLLFHEEACSNRIIQSLQKFDQIEKHSISAIQKTLELYLNKLFRTVNHEDVLKSAREASPTLRLVVQSLVDFYWAQLINLKGEEDEVTNFIFQEFRFTYLNDMPPLQTKKSNFVLKKLEAFFCSPLVVLLDTNVFLEVSTYPSLTSILLNPEESFYFLLEKCPECLLQFGKDRFINYHQWKILILHLYKKSMNVATDDYCKFSFQFYKHLLDEALNHLATNLSLNEFEQLLSNQNEEEFDCYEAYVKLCQENKRAKKIQELIQETSKQLLSSLNFYIV